MSTDSLSFSLGQVVYLKIDTEEVGMITGILFRPNGASYAVTWASNLTEDFHFDIELTADKAYVTTPS